MKLRPPIEIYEALDDAIEQHLEKVHMKKGKLGSGSRFRAVEASAAKSGATNPAAVAAGAGRKKYGEKKMAAMAKAGKKRKAKK
jgi:hypothetical protein